MREPSRLLYRSENMLVDAVAVLVMAMIGPFGLFHSQPFGARYLYFLLTVPTISWMLFTATAIHHRTPLFQAWPPAAVMALGAVCAVVPGAGLVTALGQALFGYPMDRANLVGDILRVAALMLLFAPAHFVISVRRAPRANMPETAPLGDCVPPPASQTGAAPRPDFFRRISTSLGTQLVSLSAQDHYVEVTTTEGSELILMRLSDAISELSDMDGMRIHRSHWVVRDQVQALTRHNGKPALLLRDGRLLPVAQSRIKAVRAFVA